MKKTLIVLALVLGVVAFAPAQAFALPVIDGAISPAGEWDNTGYQYYLKVNDTQEIGIPDQYNISSATLLQEWHPVQQATDGIYLLIETFGTPSLVDQDSGDPMASISLNADFNADGNIDLIIRHDADLGTDRLRWRRPPGSITGPATDFAIFGAEGVNFKRGSVLEYFIPSTTGGTPHAPFPGNFIGTIVYDNGGDSPDDRVVGTLIPEPSTMFLFGSSLLGLLGVRFKK